MKGSSLIQLFDAKTGEETARYENKNIVTNLFKKLTEDYMAACMIYGVNPVTYLTNTSPSLFISGIQLFDNLLPLDPAVLTVPMNCGTVAHAGGLYAGTDSYRGSLNATESGAIMNGSVMTGYKKVWDFASNQANGTIKSMALCNLYGGTAGQKSSVEVGATDGQYAFSSPENINQSGSSENSLIAASGGHAETFLVGKLSTGYDLFTQSGTSGAGAVTLFKHIVPNYSAIGMFDKAVMDSTGATLTVNLGSITLNAGEYLTLQLIGDVLYGLRCNTYTAVAYIKTYSLNLVELTSVTIDYNTRPIQFGYTNFAIVAGILYVTNQTGIMTFWMYNATTGAYISLYTPSNALPNAPCYMLCNYNATTMAYSNYTNSNRESLYFFDGTHTRGPMPRYGYYDASYNSGGFKEFAAGSPLSLTGGRNSTFYALLTFDKTSMFTQNNLAVPIVKATTNTMKITYTLSW